MARLLSVNVGLPRDIEWKGRTVHTGILKLPVRGRCWARRLNLDGDGQGDTAGHGGEQRAVFVYQIESYRYWQDRLKRADFTFGQFGENFTVQGLPDSDVYIGDRYSIGDALFEVTQPRVTCYRIGIRMDEPQMPALLTSGGRPGFYLRVLREGMVEAGDEIVKVGQANELMSVARINALLYSADHGREDLKRALRIDALSPGWRGSFTALLENQGAGAMTGNAGLVQPEAASPVTPGFQELVVTSIEQECADVVSLELAGIDGQRVAQARPGQYVVLRLRLSQNAVPFYRSYSLSGPHTTASYRISVKIERNGRAGSFLRDRIRTGDVLDVSAPRGTFVLQPGDSPVVFVSGGIGATPVLAMLHALSAAGSPRQVLWVHSARDGEHHAFAAEAQRLVSALAHGRSYVCFSRPQPRDRVGENCDVTGHLSQADLSELSISKQSDVYICGPARFTDDMRSALAEIGVPKNQIHTETFSGDAPLNPGIVSVTGPVAPHAPKDDANTGPLVSFSRSGVVTHWDPRMYRSILELAEVCDVPVRWSCRSGVCHNCESGLVSGSVTYGPDPLDMPATGNVLICCSVPQGDVVIDI